MVKNAFGTVLILLAILGCGSDNTGTTSPIPGEDEITLYTYEVINIYPHDPNSFTQGLVYADSVFFESAGGYWGKSNLREVDPETGEIIRAHYLDSQYFAEGLTLFDNKLIQLTWREKTAFVYDISDFTVPVKTFSYDTEGWGLTNDSSRLIMSDGSSTIYFRDPRTFEITGKIEVRDNDGPVTDLNELEYIDGFIYANIWYSDIIVIISSEDGKVKGKADLSGLLPDSVNANVLNGIAWDDNNKRLFVTGKLWPYLYEIKLVRSGK